MWDWRDNNIRPELKTHRTPGPTPLSTRVSQEDPSVLTLTQRVEERHVNLFNSRSQSGIHTAAQLTGHNTVHTHSECRLWHFGLYSIAKAIWGKHTQVSRIFFSLDVIFRDQIQVFVIYLFSGKPYLWRSPEEHFCTFINRFLCMDVVSDISLKQLFQECV